MESESPDESGSCPAGFTPNDLRSYLLERKAGIEDRRDIQLHIDGTEGEGCCETCRDTVRILRATEALLRAQPLTPDPAAALQIRAALRAC